MLNFFFNKSLRQYVVQDIVQNMQIMMIEKLSELDQNKVNFRIYFLVSSVFS